MAEPSVEAADGSSRGDEICSLHLIQRCGKDGCDKVHSQMSYQWQIWRSDQWTHLPNNQEIEEDYCNPANTQHDGPPVVDFQSMTCESSKVRRISSRAVTPGHALSCLSTRWQWHWEEREGTWNTYRSQGEEDQSSGITSEELERRYLSGETTVTFTARHHQYDLSFTDMLQTNRRTKKQRLVRRRPEFISEAHVKNTCEKYCSRGMPTHWDPTLLPALGYKRIQLVTSSSEYSTVLSLFNRTMPGCSISSINRIQNLAVWNFFNLQKDNMKTKAGKDVDERLLFHGTNSQHVDAICRDNIDWRMCGKNGTRYGKGSYFARDAKYSNQYTSEGDEGTRSMFVCRVLVGDYTAGRKDFTKPPFRDADETCAFDSCVDNISNPRVFVVFEKSQIYPEYLIEYELPEEEDEEAEAPGQSTNQLQRHAQSTNQTQLPGQSSNQAQVLTQSINKAQATAQSTNQVQLPAQGTKREQLSGQGTDNTLSAQSTNQVQLPGQSTNKSLLPGQGANPAQGTNQTQLPVQSKNQVQLPVQSSNQLQLLTQSTNKAQLPVQSTNQAQLPVHSTNKGQLPVQDTNQTDLVVQGTKQTDHVVQETNQEPSSPPTQLNQLCPTPPTRSVSLSTVPNRGKPTTAVTNQNEPHPTVTNQIPLHITANNQEPPQSVATNHNQPHLIQTNQLQANSVASNQNQLHHMLLTNPAAPYLVFNHQDQTYLVLHKQADPYFSVPDQNQSVTVQPQPTPPQQPSTIDQAKGSDSGCARCCLICCQDCKDCRESFDWAQCMAATGRSIGLCLLACLCPFCVHTTSSSSGYW